VHFANVPAGTRYSVVESTELPNGWTQTATDNAIGTVPANDTAAATVTNTYDATGVVSLEASKTMRSGLLAAGQFDFQLKEGDNVLQTVANLEPEEGTATGQILFDPLEYQLSDLFQDGVYVGPKTYTYTIAEVVPEGADEQTIDGNTVYASGGVIYGADGVRSHTVTVEVADSGTGSLTVTPSTSTASIGFINDYEPGSLEVAKTTTGTNAASADAKFTFSVKLTDAQGAAVNRSYDLVRIAADGTETTTTDGAQFIDGTAAIAGVGNGERFRIVGIAKDADYEVSEYNVPAGFKQAEVSGLTGTIGAGQMSEASFTNAYEAEGSVALQANKTLEDGNIADYTFTFQLYDETNKLLQTKANDATGVVTFDELGYSAADAGTRDNPKKYTYKIAEVNDAQKNVAYDTHSGWLDVSVWDEGEGELTVQAVYDHASGSPSTTPETFANKILQPIEMPTTGGNGWAIPIAAAAIVATAEAARRMRRRQRNESKS
jgi:pilin isopeptide linkage protein